MRSKDWSFRGILVVSFFTIWTTIPSCASFYRFLFLDNRVYRLSLFDLQVNRSQRAGDWFLRRKNLLALDQSLRGQRDPDFFIGLRSLQKKNSQFDNDTKLLQQRSLKNLSADFFPQSQKPITEEEQGLFFAHGTQWRLRTSSLDRSSFSLHTLTSNSNSFRFYTSPNPLEADPEAMRSWSQLLDNLNKDSCPSRHFVVGHSQDDEAVKLLQLQMESLRDWELLFYKAECAGEDCPPGKASDPRQNTLFLIMHRNVYVEKSQEAAIEHQPFYGVHVHFRIPSCRRS